MAQYRVHHKTVYHYESDVATSHQCLHLEPLGAPTQILHRFRLNVSPDPGEIQRGRDYFGNSFHSFDISEPHRALEVETRSDVSVLPRDMAMPLLTPACSEAARLAHVHEDPLSLTASEFVLPSPRIPLLREAHDFAAPLLLPDRPVLDAALALCAKVKTSFRYKPGVTDASSPIQTLLKLGQGVCQDFSHFTISCLRSHGIAAAYMSGYIRTNPPPGRPRLVGADASHAWVTVLVPQLGWVEIDPTNNCLVGEDHISVGRGRDYGDLSMIRGSILGGGLQTIRVAVTVEPIEERVAVARPL